MWGSYERAGGVYVCTRRTDQIDHDLQVDHLDPCLPLRDVVQYLYNTDASQETCLRSCRLYGSHAATCARSYRSGKYLSCLADLDHDLGINHAGHLSEA